MNRTTTSNPILAALLLAALTACQSSSVSPDGAKPDQSLVVFVDINGNMRAGGYYFTEADIPQLVKQWHVTSATVIGDTSAKFADLLKVQADLQSAGVPTVTIDKRTDADN